MCNVNPVTPSQGATQAIVLRLSPQEQTLMHTDGIAIEAETKTLRIFDTITREQYSIHTDRQVTPTVSDDSLAIPISQTVRIQAASLRLNTPARTYLREVDGEIVDELSFGDALSRQTGRWLLDFQTPVKTYAQIEAPFTVSITDGTVEVQFERQSAIILGVRAYRRHPTETITTTRAPADIATTISHLSAGLETLSPERSFPTLRNHPPNVEFGAQLQIPPSVEWLDSTTTIHVPFTYEYLYAVAPVAYYLNATLKEGSPKIHIDGHGTWELPDETFADRCAQLLKQCVFLDCITRTEGLYPTTLEERVQVEPTLDLDWADLYTSTFETRTATYLDVEYSTIADVVPTWHARGYVPPVAQTAELLPHLLDQLTPVEVIEPEEIRGDDARRLALQRFMDSQDALSRSQPGHSTFEQDIPFVDIPIPPEREALWIGDGIPFGGNHLFDTGIQRYHASDEPDSSEITVTLVCNDSEMVDEIDSAEGIYDSREKVRLSVNVYRNLTTDQLAKQLADQSDLFHFIGHASTAGLHCPDGVLSPSTVDSVGTRAFFLNACSSYIPGRELIDAGAIGGVVTLSDVTEQSAEQVGVMTANLLSIGFSLRNALWIARDQSIVGGQYICVGMDSLWLTHPDGLSACAVTIDKTDSGWRIQGASYPSLHFGIGSMTGYKFDPEGRMSLAGGIFAREGLSDATLREFLQADESPVRYDGEWMWGDQVLELL